MGNRHNVHSNAQRVMFVCDNRSEDTLHGKPEIINSDQGSQFTSPVYIEYLKGLEKVKISMDGKGRATDNIFIERLWKSVKYEWIICMYMKME
ncbi:MAG: transposase family protein [Ignavibacteria bacterium]|nr:transposase family protein [Ignavibacteria bacterium]